MQHYEMQIGSGEDKTKVSLDGTEDTFFEAVRACGNYAKRSDVDLTREGEESDDDFQEAQERTFDEIVADIKSLGISDKVPAGLTTISCSDGNVKANYLLTLTRDYTAQFFESWVVPKAPQPTRHPGAFYAAHAGQFAKFKTSIEGGASFKPGKYTLGLSSVKLELTETERLFIEDEALKSWITNDLGLAVTRWDLPYRGFNDVVGIDTILKKILSTVYCRSNKRLVPSNELGTIQLYCAFPQAYPLGYGPYYGILRSGALHKFLDFFNALIFGVEASRNYSVFFSGLLTLCLMRNGSSPNCVHPSSITYDDLLDLFPMSVLGTGKGNLMMEKALHLSTTMAIRNSGTKAPRTVGFHVFRHNPKWLQVTLRSAKLIYFELANVGLLEYAKDRSMEQFCKDFQEQVLYELYLHHYARCGSE